MLFFPIPLLSLILAILHNTHAATNADFIALKGKLQEYIAQNPDRHIPLLVRTSFHDLFLQNKAALRGCLKKEAFVGDLENRGLDQTIKDLQNIVKDLNPKSDLSFGDVIAFGGKIAVESAYPCIRIPFKFNRENCSQAKPNLSHQAPSAFIETIDQLGPMLEFLGSSITAEDMAILFAGGHGIKGARAGPSGWFGVFSTFSSGRDFIIETFSSTWKFISNEQTLAQFFKGDSFNRQTSIIRLPTDMIFYPSKIPDGSFKDTSAESAAIEATLKGFTRQNRNVFDNAFAKAYAKLLAIGNGDQAFVENGTIGTCPDQPDIPHPSTTTSVVLPTSTDTVPPRSTPNTPPPTATVTKVDPTLIPETPSTPNTESPPTSITEISPTATTDRQSQTTSTTCSDDRCQDNHSQAILSCLWYCVVLFLIF